MNRLERRRIIKSCSGIAPALATIALASLALSACHDANARQDADENAITAVRPDDQLTELTRTVREGDAKGFASLCVYPIVRPYPLKDIPDSVSMVDYYPVLVDDSLKVMLGQSKLDDWENYGWRGWSVGDSRPIWFNDGIQIIDYVSPAENGLKSILAREEIMSLAPQFREGWNPVATLVETGGDNVFRIDSNGEVFRLMKFDNASKVHDEPSLLLTGSLKNEGTADSPIFEFFGSNGFKAVYMPDSEPPVCVYVTNPKDSEIAYPVVTAYWRDIIR